MSQPPNPMVARLGEMPTAAGIFPGSHPEIVAGYATGEVAFWDSGVHRLMPGRHGTQVVAVTVDESQGRPRILSMGAIGDPWAWDISDDSISPLRALCPGARSLDSGTLDGSPVLVASAAAQSHRRRGGLTIFGSRLILRDLTSDTDLHIYGHEHAIRAVAVGPSIIASAGSVDRTVRLWKPDGSPRCPPLRSHLGEVSCVTLGRLDGVDVVASGSWDGFVRVWDLDGTPLLTLPAIGQGVTAVAVAHLSTFGDVILSAGGNYQIQVWNSSGELLMSPIVGHTSFIDDIKIDGHGFVTVSCKDRTVRRWTASGEEISVEHIHQPSIPVNTRPILEPKSLEPGDSTPPPREVSDGFWLGGVNGMSIEDSIVAQAASDPAFGQQTIDLLSRHDLPEDVGYDPVPVLETLRQLQRDPVLREQVRTEMTERHGYVYEPPPD